MKNYRLTLYDLLTAESKLEKRPAGIIDRTFQSGLLSGNDKLLFGWLIGAEACLIVVSC